MAPQDNLIIPARRAIAWSGIFAGTFCFLAIEATFGALGAAIFGSFTPAGVATPLGFQIWMCILSIIALYFAGRVSTLYLARSSESIGRCYGLVTFGMSIFATVLVFAAANLYTLSAGIAGRLSTANEYWLFVTLLLSGISAMIGAVNGMGEAPVAGTQPLDSTMRTAA